MSSPSSSYVFFQPTFTQGLIIGQLSIFFLLGLILKYLFLESSQSPSETTYHPQVDNDAFLRKRALDSMKTLSEDDAGTSESTEWFNALLKQVRWPLGSERRTQQIHFQVLDVYRSKLRNDLPGLEGDEIARKRVED